MNTNGNCRAHALVVAEKHAALRAVADLSAIDRCQCEAVPPCEAVQRIGREPLADVAFVDFLLASADNMQLLRELRRMRPAMKVVMLSAPDDIDRRVEAAKLGAEDFLSPSSSPSQLQTVLLRCLDAKFAAIDDSSKVDELPNGVCFVSTSPLMHKIRAQAELLAKFDVPILILGESGTGKEVMARLIHSLSARSSAPFLKVNCAAFPSELLESELFGYEPGAFTGATRTRRGKFELCGGGTILLDEVAEMPAPLQPKLLHVLQDKQFFRLGGEAAIRVDVRILAATNVEVHKAIAERRLREDLYYRLGAFTIQLPPLRERAEEIEPLLRHFVRRIATRHGRVPLPFSQAILDACLKYSWPGNLRELENFVNRYVVMADEELALSELQPKTNGNGGEPTTTGNGDGNGNGSGNGHSNPWNGSAKSLKDMVQVLKNETEVKAIIQALEETRWNRKEAAKLLHISYRGLLYKIQQHHIVRAIEARAAAPSVMLSEPMQ